MYAGPYLFKEVDVSELAATLAQNEQQGKDAGTQQCARSKDTYIHTYLPMYCGKGVSG